MEQIKVSVIVPVYNVEAYLVTCLESLVGQTLQEIEIVVVNDGSPDNSQAIIDDYAARYPEKIRAYVKENGGLSDARNFGVAKATGEYIAFVDSDDYVDINAYELLYNKAKETDSDVVAFPYTDVVDRTVTRKYLGDSLQYFGKSAAEAPRVLRYANSLACNKIFRRSFWLEKQFAFPVGQWFEDSALIYQVLWCANKIECVNVPFYYYVRTREDSITNTVTERVFDVFKSAQSIVDFFSTCPQTPELVEEVTYLCLRHTFARAFRFNTTKNKAMARRFLDECYTFFDKNLPEWRSSKFVSPSKKASRTDRLHGFILRHKALAKVYYVGNLLQCIEKALLAIKNFFTVGFKRQLSAKKRLEIMNEKKRQAIQTNGVAVMCLVQRLLKEIDVLSFADFGTMLGIVREGRLLAHDLDMDMGVIIKEKRDMDRIRLHLEEFGFALWRQYVFADNIVEESYRFCGIKVDLNYYKISETNSKTWLFYREPGQEYLDNTRNIVEMTYSPITDFQTVQIQGEDVVIPANALQLLEEKYGPTWRTPDKGWIYWLSPAATKIPDIGYYIDHRYKRTVEPNEAWFAKVREKELAVVRLYQQKQVAVLKAVSALCEQNDIAFCLGNDSLQFAKQYGTMAPWETRLYLTMTKENYDKFLAVAAEQLPDKMVLQHSGVTKNYWLPHAAVRTTDKTGLPAELVDCLTKKNRPGVEIIPLCPVPQETSEAQEKQAAKYQKYTTLLAYKTGAKKAHGLKGKLVKASALMTSYTTIHQNLARLYSQFDGERCDYVVNLASSKNIKKTTVPAAWFAQTEPMSFEGLTVPVPEKAEEILKLRYGYRYNKPLIWKKRKIRLPLFK